MRNASTSSFRRTAAEFRDGRRDRIRDGANAMPAGRWAPSSLDPRSSYLVTRRRGRTRTVTPGPKGLARPLHIPFKGFSQRRHDFARRSFHVEQKGQTDEQTAAMTAPPTLVRRDAAERGRQPLRWSRRSSPRSSMPRPRSTRCTPQIARAARRGYTYARVKGHPNANAAGRREIDLLEGAGRRPDHRVGHVGGDRGNHGADGGGGPYRRGRPSFTVVRSG